MNQVAVQISGLSKSYESKTGRLSVLDNISLSINQGDIVSLVGQSGCGKTTLLNILSGIVAPTSGAHTVNGTVGYVPQTDLLLAWRNVLENVLLPIEISRTATIDDVKKAEDLLERSRLTDFRSHYPQDLSGGMRQRVSLIRTLVHNPDIILFDEPFSAIDFSSRLTLVREVRSYLKQNNKTAIFVTHNIEEAIAIGDRVMVLSSRPAHIVLEETIKIPETSRDPLEVRKTDDFQNVFERIWKYMSIQTNE